MYELTRLKVYTAADNGLILLPPTRLRSRILAFFALIVSRHWKVNAFRLTIDPEKVVTDRREACHILRGLGCVLGWGWCRIESVRCFHVGADLGARSRAEALSAAV
jgi:hypothetical protein